MLEALLLASNFLFRGRGKMCDSWQHCTMAQLHHLREVRIASPHLAACRLTCHVSDGLNYAVLVFFQCFSNFLQTHNST